MIDTISPVHAGVKEHALAQLLHTLEANSYNAHSLLLARRNGLFFEKYWAPFTANTPHRMYSVTKSFVSVAIGLLIEEGKLSLDDCVVDFFPDKLPKNLSPLMAEQTVRHMLMMNTCLAGVNWFKPGITDRTAYYFQQKPVKPAGTLFDYDSTGSYVLGTLVERLSGMPLLSYLKMKLLDQLGGFENAHILQTPDGTSWGDSALLCTPRALLNFARFVMDGGVWEGQQLMNREYLQEATNFQTSNNNENCVNHNRYGYGYQIWRTERNGFAFLGMGGQYAICLPEDDLICVSTADTQMHDSIMAPLFFRAVMDFAASLHPAQPPLPIDSLLHSKSALPVARGTRDSAFARRIDRVRFICEDNPMGIRTFQFDFEKGLWAYENAQGHKELFFGAGYNVFGKFPQDGYSDEYGNVHIEDGFRYDCAASAGWVECQKLQILVQIIDRYFGTLVITFGFQNENVAGIRMVKKAEDFLDEYDGLMIARREYV